MSPDAFAARCRQIVETEHGHAAHRALDVLTNDALSSLGFAEGIAIFESAVAAWHGTGHAYPYSGPCPTCEARPARTYRLWTERDIATLRELRGTMTRRQIALRLGRTFKSVKWAIESGKADR